MLSTIEIIGSVFYAEHYAKKENVREALFVATSGAQAPLLHQKTFSGTSTIDRIMAHLAKYYVNSKYEIFHFRQGGLGNDEIFYGNSLASKKVSHPMALNLDSSGIML